LASTVTENDLRTAFSGFGTVIDAVILKNKITGKSLGRANVFIVPERAGNQAIETLDKVVLRGKPMKVRQCVFRSKDERRNRGKRWADADRRRAPERRDTKSTTDEKPETSTRITADRA
jgi:RNA recognition motif-containing protein